MYVVANSNIQEDWVIMVRNCNRDAESAVELRHGVGGRVPIVYHHHYIVQQCGLIFLESSFVSN